ncbi:MAG: polysaccharide biosynthesis protein [Bacteroidales bacterium]|nr:polysaccharide biosynthesis protein [Bacteroidales bacterium]
MVFHFNRAKIVNFALIMANPLKQLAGQTMIYGLSTILARIINFLLVPIYTRVLSPENYGVVTEFMAYIAVLQVVLVLGLETGCFRFANKEGVDPRKVYSSAFVTVFSVGATFLALMLAFANPIASALGYDGYGACIRYMGGILALDAVTAILFAKLRQENKAFKFAIFKTVKIVAEMGANLYLFLVFPKHVESHSWLLNFIPATPDFSYVIFSIFVSCVVCGLLFIPDFFKLSFSLDRKLTRQMLAYSLPLMVAALPGIMNDFLDRILFRFFDSNPDQWRESVGLYQAAVKLAVIMNLFIQMFRYAAEPFFFRQSREKGSLKLYADVQEYFTAFCGLVFLGVILYIDIIALILGPQFREAVGIVPIMLLSYMILGMLFNVSMWYKLSGKTNVAIWITLSGLAVTALVIVLFMPTYSYWAAAYGHLASYIVMFIISAVLGAKYYPIPYRWGRLLMIMLLMGAVYGVSLLIDSAIFSGFDIRAASAGQAVAKLGIHTALILSYLAGAWYIIRARRTQK